MQVTKEQLDPCTVELAFTVEAEAVSKAFGRAYREFGAFTAVPGFRPGKAPRAMVEKFAKALSGYKLHDDPALAGFIETDVVQTY